MAIKTVGEDLQASRIQKGMTIEQLADGIYSNRNLSRILSGNSRGTQEIFEKLMERVELDTDFIYGSKFKSEQNFQWFYLFIQVRFNIVNGHIQEAIDLLSNGISNYSCINNTDYQEFLILYSRILIILNRLDEAKSKIIQAYSLTNQSPITEKKESYSDLELELLLLYFDADHSKKSVEEIENIYSFFDLNIPSMHREHLMKQLLKDLYFYVAKKYFFEEEYKKTIELLESHRNDVLESVQLVEYIFFQGVSYLKLSESEKGMELINQAVYSSAATNSSFFLKQINFLENYLGIKFEKIDNKELYNYPNCDNLSKDIPSMLCEYPDESFSINNIICSVRESRGITLNKLSNGLLTVKSLHSYEKGTQKISATVIEALLERLGIASDYFTIYGKAREAKYFNLREQISQNRKRTKEERIAFLEELKATTDFNNSIEAQFYQLAYYKMVRPSFDSIDEEINYLKSALSLTLPDFDIYNIQNYLLSQQEYKILLSIAQLYLFEEKKRMNEGIYYLEQLLRYMEHNECDIMLKTFTEGIMLITYIRNTYQNNANILFDYEERFLKKISVCSNLKYVELAYFYYIQTYNGILIYNDYKNKINSSTALNLEVIMTDEIQGIISLMKRYYLYACMTGDLLKSGNPNTLRNHPDLSLFRNCI